MTYLAHPANVAVILARHGADEVTLVAGILHHVLEVTPRAGHRDISGKIEDKFGVSVLTLARAALEPREDDRGHPLPWIHRKRAMLTQLLTMPPRAIDICCADEIHQCGTAIAVVERLGDEYLAPHGLPHGPAAVCWYDDLAEALGRRLDWPAGGMRRELMSLCARLKAAFEAP